MQVKKQQLEPDMEQGIGSKLGKEYVMALYSQSAYLTSMKSEEVRWSDVAQCVQRYVTPWTVPYQTPPSMGFSRQEYWSGLPLPSPENTGGHLEKHYTNIRDNYY